MKKASAAFIPIGKIGSPYGLQGWLKVHPYTDFGDGILQYTPWYVAKNNEWDAIKIEEKRIHGKKVIVKLSGVRTPEEARSLTGQTIAITRSQLPILERGEYYWVDLEGLTVINKNGEILGKVIYLIATGSNDVLVVKGKKEHGIPYLPNKIIQRVDLAKQEIHVDWEVI